VRSGEEIRMSSEPGTKSHDPGPWTSGDLARRLRDRRHALGLTLEDVAAGAEMDPGFVELLERRPTILTGGALIRLADTLHTTASDLLGSDPDRASGRGPAAAHPVLEPMGPTECMRLLERGGVGRVAVASGEEIDVLPVNFVVHDGMVVFRTKPSTVLAGEANGRVTFEIDRIDEGMRSGWSVLVRGPARVLAEPELRLVEAGAEVETWAGGERDLYVAVTPERVSGRRIHV
jgi:transcriptional regulator with XRE-family HTH domain